MPVRLVAGLALALVAGCGGNGLGGSRGCTEIGCVSGVFVTVDQPGGRPLEACVGEVCSPPNELSIVNLEPPEPTVVVVRVAAGGAEVARATATPARNQPNGEGCPPVCRLVRLRLTVDDQLVPG